MRLFRKQCQSEHVAEVAVREKLLWGPWMSAGQHRVRCELRLSHDGVHYRRDRAYGYIDWPPVEEVAR